jgi:predicted RNase H-like nuclease
MTNIAGVDGCRSGWLCVRSRDGAIDADVFATFRQLLAHLVESTVIAVDIPIGLPTSGERACDRMVRQALGSPRASSVFPAPVWAVIDETDYASACSIHRDADGRALSRQAFAILPKIREVNRLLIDVESLQPRIREIHPELCFTVWNGGRPMQHRKSVQAGAADRERLIDREWPGVRELVAHNLPNSGWQSDDLCDAFAALWTAGRIASGVARTFGSRVRDAHGLPMEMSA